MTRAPEASSGQASGVIALIGTWRLAEHSNWDSAGSLIQVFGAHPVTC